MIKIIVAMASNGVIGKENGLPWVLPTDMKHFKNITSGHSVLMGRKCWESIPDKFRPLPNRNNIVLTRNTSYVAKGATVEHSLEDVISKFKKSNNVLFIIGGSEIYNESFKHAKSMFLTNIYNEVDGDIYLTGLNNKEWDMKEMSELIHENGLTYTINYYEKK